MRSRLLSSEKGSAMAMALFSLVIVSLFGIGMYQTITIQMQQGVMAESRAKAYYLAKSGVEVAVGMIRDQGESYLKGRDQKWETYYGNISGTFSTDKAEGNPSISFTVSRSNSRDDVFTITSTGFVQNGKREFTDELVYKITFEDLFRGPGVPMALFVSDELDIKQGASVVGNIGIGKDTTVVGKGEYDRERVKVLLDRIYEVPGTLLLTPELNDVEIDEKNPVITESGKYKVKNNVSLTIDVSDADIVVVFEQGLKTSDIQINRTKGSKGTIWLYVKGELSIGPVTLGDPSRLVIVHDAEGNKKATVEHGFQGILVSNASHMDVGKNNHPGGHGIIYAPYIDKELNLKGDWNGTIVTTSAKIGGTLVYEDINLDSFEELWSEEPPAPSLYLYHDRGVGTWIIPRDIH